MPSDATLAMQKQILANQKNIIANRQRIQRNQEKLDKIVANQGKLDRILANQKAILAKLRGVARAECALGATSANEQRRPERAGQQERQQIHTSMRREAAGRRWPGLPHRRSRGRPSFPRPRERRSDLRGPSAAPRTGATVVA